MTTRGVAVLATVLALAGCSASAKQQPAAPVTTAAESASMQDTAFLTRVRATVTGGSDAALIQAAQRACDQIKTGSTELDAASTLVTGGFSTGDSAAIVTAAEAVYCKQP